MLKPSAATTSRKTVVTGSRVPALALAVCSLLTLGGCVSAVTPLQVDSNSSAATMAPITLNVATGEAESAAVSEVASVETGGSFANSTSVGNAAENAAAGEIAVASIIPTPAPRKSSDDPGIAMAFASTDESATAPSVPAVEAAATNNEAAAPVATGAGMQSEPVTQAVAAAPTRPKSLFEALFARRKTTSTASQTRVASLTPAAPVTASASAGLANTGSALELPGVKDNNSLFSSTDEDESDNEGGVRLASVGAMSRMSPLGIVTQTDRVEVGCFKPELISILGTVERHYGKKPIVTSGYRNPSENRRAGGARKSMHMLCQAADIQVEGVSKWDLAKYLRTVEGRGGVGTYCRTNSVHIDTGEERDWHYPCRRKKKKRA
ncbi:MAG: D-Ala-D-Ala carboxypeptidase family metallohydrolase [Nitratireductor sp.]